MEKLCENMPRAVRNSQITLSGVYLLDAQSPEHIMVAQDLRVFLVEDMENISPKEKTRHIHL